MQRAAFRASQPPPLSSGEEVRQALELPLVAELSLSPSASPRRPRLDLGRTVRVATRVAEAVVAAAIVVCLFSAFADQSLAGEFTRDPLGAMSVAIDRLLR